jgi:hypothetical protein
MSHFLQTLIPGGLLFREQEHRRERIGVGMPLWPTGPTTGEEANEIEIGSFKSPPLSIHESGGRILVATLLALIVTAAAGAQSAPAVSPAEARKAIQAGYAVWAKAVVAPMDRKTVESMLGPDLYVQTATRKLTRQEFIDALFTRPLSLTRFDATVLTVEPKGDEWAAIVFEKLEGEIKDENGKTVKVYIMGVARDGWGKSNDNQWTLRFSEQLGQQRSQESPPVANW